MIGRSSAIVLLTATFVGCAPVQRTIMVESVPPGAAIEVNDVPVGDAPVEVAVECGLSGTLWRSYRITALPEGAFVQTKWLVGTDRPPERLVFHTDREPFGGAEVETINAE